MEKNLNKVSKKKILILGASSDIGIQVVKKFLKKNWHVIAHSNKNNKKLSKIKNESLSVFKLDLSSPQKVENYIKKIHFILKK